MNSLSLVDDYLGQIHYEKLKTLLKSIKHPELNDAIMNLLIWTAKNEVKKELWLFVKNKLSSENFLSSIKTDI